MFDGVGQVLMEARRELGVTQQEVAERAEISVAMVSAYERGKASPQLVSLGKVLAALGLDAEEFGRRLRVGRGPRAFEPPEISGWVPGRTAVDASQLLEDMAALLRLSIRRPAPVLEAKRAAGERTGGGVS
jgi:transcriptional regulator with XRE-family HTH domain